MLSTQRKHYLMQTLERDGTLQVKDVAKALATSETTIRRDLRELEKDGFVNRVHGGAIREGFDRILNQSSELLMLDRMQINQDRKRLICKAACECIQDGECIFLDGGTSIVAMIEFLSKRPIRIVTHNHLIVSKLHQPVAEIIVIGGNYHAQYAMSVGSLAQNMMNQYHVDRAFISCAGIELTQGMSYTAEMETREIKQIAMRHANHAYLLIDDSKLGVTGFCQFQDINDFDAIFCNSSDKLPEELPPNFIIVET